MYEYTDAYDEAENGGQDGGPIILTRTQVVEMFKRHSLASPAEWFEYFSLPKNLTANTYTASSVLEWLNY